MKRKVLPLLAGAFLALTLPFFMGINCCCFVYSFSKPACHSQDQSPSEKSDAAAGCQCAKQAIYKNENSQLAGKINFASFKNNFIFDFILVRCKMESRAGAFAFSDSSPPLASEPVYLSLIRIHSPPVA